MGGVEPQRASMPGLAEPSPDELADLRTVARCCAWAGMQPAMVAAYVAAVGCPEDAPARVLANVEEDDVKTIKSSLTVGGQPLTPAAKGMVVSAWHVSRLAAKVVPSQAEKQKREEMEKAEATALAKEK